MQHKTIATIALVMMTTSLTFATGSVSIPHVFSSGQAARASDVNENFKALADAINAANGPFSRGNDFTVQPASGITDGATVTVDGVTFTLRTGLGTSFMKGNNATYRVIAPIVTQSSYSTSQAITSDMHFNGADTDLDWVRSSVGGYPAAVAVTFTNSFGGGGAGAACNVVIRLDASTYFNAFTYQSIASPPPISKSDQEAAMSACKGYLDYVNIVTVPAPA